MYIDFYDKIKYNKNELFQKTADRKKEQIK